MNLRYDGVYKYSFEIPVVSIPIDLYMGFFLQAEIVSSIDQLLGTAKIQVLCLINYLLSQLHF
jgi:hypothetical protein